MHRSPLWPLLSLHGCLFAPDLGGQEGSEHTPEADVDTDTDTDSDTDGDSDTDTDTDTDTGGFTYEGYAGTETFSGHTGPLAEGEGYQCLLTLAVEGTPLAQPPAWCPGCLFAFDVDVVVIKGDSTPGCDAEGLDLASQEGVYAFAEGEGLWFGSATLGTATVVDAAATFGGSWLEYRIEEGADPATTTVPEGAHYRLREGMVEVW